MRWLGWFGRGCRASLGLSLCLAVGCGASTQEHAARHATGRGEPVEFAFGVLDGSVVTSESSHGRSTALLFVTSYDLASQVVVRRLDELARRHKPRFNAVVVVLENPENSVLVETFRDSLHLSCPVAMADLNELRAHPRFRSIDRVPTLLLLDRAGRERLAHAGGFETEELEGWLRDVEGS